MTISVDVVLAAPEGTPITQVVPWRWRAWANRWERDGLARPEVIALLREETEEHGGIRREFVFEQSSDPLKQFIAAMAWGFGRHPRAPGRMAAMLRPGEAAIDGILADIGQAVRTQTASGFTALFENRRGRIPGLATAFGTKVLYFSGYGSDVRPRPLIYDQFVWRGLCDVANAPAVPHPQRHVTPAGYTAYCEWAERIAKERSIAPDMIEYSLFEHGRRLGAA